MDSPLSSRERQVLACAGRGLSAAETGAELGISTETVKTHRRHLLGKLGARNVAHAIALSNGVAELGERPALREEEAKVSQLAAFHAKASDIDRTVGSERGTAKRIVLAAASGKFGLELTSANDLTRRQASWCLDELEETLRDLGVPA